MTLDDVSSYNQDGSKKAYWDKRNASIERQVAVKCVASMYQGRDMTEEQLVKAFRVFIRLIREGG